MSYPTEPAAPKVHAIHFQMVPVLADNTYHQAHVVPVNDMHMHKLCEHCPCQSDEDFQQPDVWVHKAWDGREAHYERGRKMH